MKRIVQKYKPEMKLIELDQLYPKQCTMTSLGTDKVIAYESRGGNYLAVLKVRVKQRPYKNEYTWGFLYLDGLLQQEVITNRLSRYTYKSENPRTSIKLAIDNDRTVLVFNSMHEFLEYAIKFYEPEKPDMKNRTNSAGPCSRDPRYNGLVS